MRRDRRRFGSLLALALVAWGLSGCDGGIKEGSPAQDVGYVPPKPEEAAEVPKAKAGARP